MKYEISPWAKKGRLTVREAAVAYQLSEEQVRRNLRSGKFRGERVGGQWFVESEETMARAERIAANLAWLGRVKANSRRICARRAPGARRESGARIIRAVRDEWDRKIGR